MSRHTSPDWDVNISHVTTLWGSLKMLLQTVSSKHIWQVLCEH